MIKKKTSNKKKIIVVAVTLPIVLIATMLFALFYQESTKEIVAVADQFKPDPSWQLMDEKITPPQIVCVDSVCPQVSRIWKVDSDKNVENVLKMSYESSLKQSVDCSGIRSNGFSPQCSFQGKISNYIVDLTLWADNTGNEKVLLKIYK